MDTWSPSSWRSFPVTQQSDYQNEEELENVFRILRLSNALVKPAKILDLRKLLNNAANGQGFLIQAGSCAESFEDSNFKTTKKMLDLLFCISDILSKALNMPIVTIGRIAGQHGKPRSSEFEDGIRKFRGVNVNGFKIAERTPQPWRLLKGYCCSQETLQHCEKIMRDYVANNQNLFSVSNELEGSSNQPELFISHEALLLKYEECFTRKQQDGNYYNLSAHFLWVGDRTRQTDHAHLEYIRGIENPIGIKISQTLQPEELVAILTLINPKKDGKVTLISRYGADHVKSHLPGHIQAVNAAGFKVIWICDPCHGNTTLNNFGYRTRSLKSIIEEIKTTFEIHQKMGSRLGGLHLEMTGDNVKECDLGMNEDPGEKYKTLCDPRLNYEQAVEVCSKFASFLSCQE